MPNKRRLTAIIEREPDSYVALCPELDIASQGTNVQEARANLAEALELFFETADATEIKARLRDIQASGLFRQGTMIRSPHEV